VNNVTQLNEVDHAEAVIELITGSSLVRSAADAFDEADPRLRSILVSCRYIVAKKKKMDSWKKTRRYLQVLRFLWIPAILVVGWFNTWFGIALSASAVICVGMFNIKIKDLGTQIEEYEDIGARVTIFLELTEKMLNLTNAGSWNSMDDALHHAAELCKRIIIIESNPFSANGEPGEVLFIGGKNSQRSFYPLRLMQTDIRALVSVLKSLGADPDNGSLKAKYDRARSELSELAKIKDEALPAAS